MNRRQHYAQHGVILWSIRGELPQCAEQGHLYKIQGINIADFPHLPILFESFLHFTKGPVKSPHPQRRLPCLTDPFTAARSWTT